MIVIETAKFINFCQSLSVVLNDSLVALEDIGYISSQGGYATDELTKRAIKLPATDGASLPLDISAGSSSNRHFDVMQNLCDRIVDDNTRFIDNKSLSVASAKDHLGYLSKIQFIFPLILISGVFGNVTTFYVMVKKCKQSHRFRLFALSLAALAFADLMVIVFGCLREYADNYMSLSLRSSSLFACKLLYFLCYVFSYFSSYLHAFISLERYFNFLTNL